MRLIDRLYQYMEFKGLSAYAFERSIGVANGYLGKQFRTGGGMGSEILERIYYQYLDLSLIWLITGEGKMILPAGKGNKPKGMNVVEEEMTEYIRGKDALIETLRKQVVYLEELNADKQKIIELMEKWRKSP